MDLDGYGLVMDLIWIDMDMWICGYMDIWMYINDDWVSLGGRGLLPSPLTRIFMRGSAPQTPHRFNGYTPPTWIRYERKYSITKKPRRSTCEYTVSEKTLAINLREYMYQKTPKASKIPVLDQNLVYVNVRNGPKVDFSQNRGFGMWGWNSEM